MRYAFLVSLSIIVLIIGCGKSDAPQPEKPSAPVIQNSQVAPVDGQSVFQKNCVPCHGTQGKGNGEAAAALPHKPADLTSARVQKKSDSELMEKITSGVSKKGMPSWRHLPEEERSAVIKYIRSLSGK